MESSTCKILSEASGSLFNLKSPHPSTPLQPASGLTHTLGKRVGPDLYDQVARPDGTEVS